MSMQKIWQQVAAGGGLFLSSATTARATAHALTISGNAWVGIMIIIGFVAIIYFVIMGALQTEERDARLRRGGGGGEAGWFGFSYRDDDDDGPDIHHGNGN